MKIAIVGSGISGLVCAHLLSQKHDVVLLEQNDYLGGHTNTVTVQDETAPAGTLDVDTGFIVYNDATYPNFIELLKQLNVTGQATEMSFSVSERLSDFEYNGHTINSLFAKRSNLLSPKFYGLLSDIVRFNKACGQVNAGTDVFDSAQQQLPVDLTLGQFMQQLGMGSMFKEYYLLPMCSAIWSMTIEEVQQFPVEFFLRFFQNHGLLQVMNRPQWRTVEGGSKQYVDAIKQRFKGEIKLNTSVLSISNPTIEDHKITIQTDSEQLVVDHVILACHSDQALNMLETPTANEQQILSAIRYTPNEAILHCDTNMLPKRKLAWASWNYVVDDVPNARNNAAAITYNMNILQKLKTEKTYCVTLNNSANIHEDLIKGVYHYHHPVYDPASFKARQQRDLIQGKHQRHFCGAYWYNGFHEDGVRSALTVCKAFGVSL